MRLFVILALCFALIFGETEVRAEQKDERVLKWSGGGIPAKCFTALFMHEDKTVEFIDLNACTQEDFGKIDTADIVQGAYEQYILIGDVAEGHVVEYTWSGGGTGHFSSVHIVKVEENMLHRVRDFSGGDRCNGGVAEVAVINGKVLNSYHVTPGDLTYLAYGEEQGVEAYEDLEASAASCIGEAVYMDDVLSAFKLSTPKGDRDESWLQKYTYQACFDGLHQEQFAKKSELTPEELRIFMDRFLAQCVEEKVAQ